MADSIGGVGSSGGVMPVYDDSRATGPDKRKSPEAQNSAVKHGGSTENAKPAIFDVGQLFSSIFSGKTPDGAQFDFGTLLGQLFEGLGKKDGHVLDSLNPQVNLLQGKTEVEVREKFHDEGEIKDGSTTFKASVDAEAHAKAKAQGRVYADKDGLHAEGSAEASAGVSAEAKGSIKGEFGSIDGRVKVSAEVYARAKGRIDADTKGVRASGEVEVGAKARAEAESNVSIAGGAVKGHADAMAEAGTGANARIDAGLKYDPLTAVVKASAGAFAGARAGFSADANICGAKVNVQGEAWSGVGLKAEVSAGLADGKFTFNFGFGVAVGVGGFIKYGVEIDLGTFGKVLGDVLGFVGGLFGGGKKADGKKADGTPAEGGGIGNVLQDAGNFLKSDTGQAALGIIGDYAKKAVSDNGSVIERDEDEEPLKDSHEIKTNKDIKAERADSLEERFSDIKNPATKKV
jgi:hypothetical protein